MTPPGLCLSDRRPERACSWLVSTAAGGPWRPLAPGEVIQDWGLPWGQGASRSALEVTSPCLLHGPPDPMCPTPVL